MKKILISASAIALFAAGPAFAQSNGSTVGQSGDDNSAEVIQSGSDATSTVTQSSNDNKAQVKQSGAGASSLVEQTGDNAAYAFAVPNNVAEVTQDGDSDSIVRQSGVAASANVVQDGDGNNSTVEQSGLLAVTGRSDLGPLNYDSTGVRQLGDGNRSFVEQKGGSTAQVIQDSSLAILGNQSDVYQGTGNGQAYVSQTGANNSSFVEQLTQACCGQPTPIASVTQIGDDNIGDIRQTSTSAGSDASIIQSDVSNESYIVQTGQIAAGAGSLALSNQSGFDNFSRIEQSADDNDADVNQEGDNNQSRIFQTGVGNTATVDQYSNSNISLITQSGTGNTATVTQGGS